MQLANEIVLVTGGTSGLGAACVQELLQHGSKVVIWDKNSNSKDKTDDLYFESCDVVSAEEVEQALANTIAKVGVPRVCIHCAGIASAQRMIGKEGAMPLERFNHVIQVNLVGTFNVMRVVANAMKDLPLNSVTNERGVLINVASIAAYEGQIGQLAYSASKGGIVSMTLPAARELARHAIRVNAIAPGLIATPLLLGMPQDVQDSLAATVTFPPRFGKPEEFAALALHIIQNTFINGEVIRLDGALRMQAR